MGSARPLSHRMGSQQDHQQQQQQEPTWLLRLPPQLEKQFFQESSVQEVYTFLDALASTQALLLNWHVLRKFGSWDLGDTVLLPHEVLFAGVYFLAALVQMVCMFAWPRAYKARRDTIALFNRVLRLLVLVARGVLVTPAHSKRQVEAFYGAVGSQLPPGHLAAASPSGSMPAGNHAQHGISVHGPARMSGVFEGAAPAGPVAAKANYTAFWKGLLMGPVIAMMHANWLVPFSVAVVMQAISFAASVQHLLASICMAASVPQAQSLLIVPTCQSLNWLFYVAGLLLDWQIPINPVQLSTASDSVCQQPLVATVLVEVWLRFVLLVLVPCAGVYWLEAFLKTTFLSRYARTAMAAAAAAATAGSLGQHQAGPQLGESSSELVHAGLQEACSSGQQMQEGTVHSSAGSLQASSAAVSTAQATTTQQQQQHQGQQGQQQQQRQALQIALQSVRPASVRELLLPASGCQFVRCAVGTGLVLCVGLMSWGACELVVIALLQDGRRFVCDAEGWLRLG